MLLLILTRKLLLVLTPLATHLPALRLPLRLRVLEVMVTRLPRCLPVHLLALWLDGEALVEFCRILAPVG